MEQRAAQAGDNVIFVDFTAAKVRPERQWMVVMAERCEAQAYRSEGPIADSLRRVGASWRAKAEGRPDAS